MLCPKLTCMLRPRPRTRRFSTAILSQPLNFINGTRSIPTSHNETENITVFNPAKGEIICETVSSGSEDVDRAVQAAKNAFPLWSQLSGFERGKILLSVANRIKERREELAELEVLDNGKPIWEARVDVQSVIDGLEYNAGLAPTISGQQIQLPGGSFAYTRREPLGVCVGIGAWNFPVQIAGWKSAPALACGNTMVYKPSQFTPLSALLLAEIYNESGIPDGVFNVIQGQGETGRLLTSHHDVAKVSFTGSVPTGKKIMADCAGDIKKITLELGGKSPLIIFADCNIDNAVKGAMLANFMTQGEVCSNGTRVFVEQSIKDEFLEKLLDKIKDMKIGDPMAEDTMVGAMISKEHMEKVLGYIEGAKLQGANILCGGERVYPEDPSLSNGYFLSPCVMDNCTDDMTAVQEEIFGPAMAVLTFETEEEVIKRANATKFGLAGGVFTSDLTRGHRVIANLQSGTCFINNYNLYPIEMPFGGYKQSGLGRELGTSAIDSYTQTKMVYVEMGDVDCPY
ncbi:4-trimethylaminobutyraldehyde dehydrogenase A-like [Anneissia japonica]|uniref:4-trimethylaminobutyraldehyde dehydrogenase A-like n=1 Tax=Anneissia japonica TaxID=1529436 RepID=UPI0014258B70|nr:4-trimethylaminobutyraldehyde dehydrogenase A-like [Anneissia japonica]